MSAHSVTWPWRTPCRLSVATSSVKSVWTPFSSSILPFVPWIMSESPGKGWVYVHVHMTWQPVVSSTGALPPCFTLLWSTVGAVFCQCECAILRVSNMLSASCVSGLERLTISPWTRPWHLPASFYTIVAPLTVRGNQKRPTLKSTVHPCFVGDFSNHWGVVSASRICVHIVHVHVHVCTPEVP